MNTNIKDVYLKLHSADDNSVMIINSGQIVYMNVNDDNKTVICTYDDEEERVVNETPDKIYNLIEKSLNTFVRVHRSSDNTIEYFNREFFIACVVSDDDYTNVCLQNMIQMSVNETPEKVYNQIMETVKNNQ